MRNIISAVLGLITAIFIICLAVTLTLNCTALYKADISRYNLTEETGMSEEEILANYQAVIDYNNIGGPDTLSLPTLAMSEGGRIHFEEVRVIFYAMEYAAGICGAITIAAMIFTTKKRLYGYRFASGVMIIALPTLTGIAALISWDKLFILFHRLMFDNDYWIFDSLTDPIITILPDGYFLHCMIMIIAISFAGAAAFLLWYAAARRRLKYEL